MKMILTRQAVLSEYEALLNFENRIFDIDFLKKVPKLYADPARCVACHGVILDGGRIAAAVAAWPTEIETDCGTLRALGIGSVAVSPEARGKGCMKDMMAFCNRRAEELQADFAFLSGARGRYEHDGYRPCGSRYLFEVTPYFVRHFRGEKGYVFSPLAEDAAGCREAQALFSAQPLHYVRRKEDFLLFSTTWGAQSFSVRDADGAFCGYLILEAERAHVSELLLRDPAKAEGVLAAFGSQTGKDLLTVAAEPSQTALIRALAAFGEHIRVEMPAAFKVFHWQRFLEVLGSCRAKYASLPEGSVVLKIEDETLRVTVRDGRCIAEPTEEMPALRFSSKEAAVQLTTGFGRMAPHPLFAAWAPLCPLGIPHADNV